MTSKQVDLTKNFFALGLMFWLYERSMDPTLTWIDKKFSGRPVIAEANRGRSRRATPSARPPRCSTRRTGCRRRSSAPGTYRNITGNEATALGFLAAARLAERDLFYGSYPITPATDILQQLAGYKSFGVRTFQAEDEIAAMGSTIGAAYGGALALTGTSGPGLALKSGGDGPGRHDRAADGHRQRAARRPLHGPADQDGAGGPAAGPLRPQRRVADAGPRAGHAGRVLHARHRGVAHRAQVHDPGHRTSRTRSSATARSRGASRTSRTCRTSPCPTR